MQNPSFRLFFSRRFLPIFACQFLGAFNDNLLRSGLMVLIAYASTQGAELPMSDVKVLITLCSALLIVPFILFGYLAGQVADKYEKAQLVTWVKVAEVLIMLGAAYGFYTANIVLLMVMLFISGTHSTFFGPIKYSILPEKLGAKELLAGNGFISGGTYIGILLGMITGGLLGVMDPLIIGLTLLSVAFIGLGFSLLIQRGKPAAPRLHINFHLAHGTVEMVSHARENPRAFRAMMGLSWFLLVGSVFMAQFVNYAHEVVRADNEVYTLFMTIFSLGIALGCMLCDKLLKGEVTAKLSPLALLGVSVFTILMVMATPNPEHDALMTLSEFLDVKTHWLLMGAMLAVAVSGGIYMVPLYAMLQTESKNENRSQVIAASNMFDSLFMVVAAIVSAALLMFGAGITDLFLILAVLNLLMAYYAYRILTRRSR